MPAGRIGKACKPLVENYGLPKVAEHWAHYLGATSAQYASPQRFADTFGSWETLGGASTKDGSVTHADAVLAFKRAGLDTNVHKVHPEGYSNQMALQRAIRNTRGA